MNPTHPTLAVRLAFLADLARVALLLLALGDATEGSAQLSAPGLSGTTITRYYPAPNFKQLDLKLTGERITMLPDNAKQFRAIKPEFWAYQENGALLITLRTPECLWDESDAKKRQLNSAEELSVTTGDGRFHIQGRGFLWQHNERLLTISNNVRAVVQWTNTQAPLVITSRWFQLDVDKRRGVFYDDVRGEDDRQVFDCGLLAISATTNQLQRGTTISAQTNRATFDLIEADGGLRITGKEPGQSGRARRGIYHHADQRVDLLGDAAWSFNNYSGAAERMTVWLNNTNIDASGKVKLSLPRGALGAAGSLLSTTNLSTRSTDTNLVTLFADRFTRRDEQLLAEGAVRISDGTNQLTCDRLEAKQSTPRSPEEYAIATGKVFVGREGGGIHSDRADYSPAKKEVLFTGNPRFVQGEVTGTAGRVIAHTLTRELRAEDKVVVAFPLATDRGSILNFLPNEGTNRVAATKPVDQKVRITAQNFRLLERTGTFAGNVTAHQLPADGSEARMKCGELEVRLAPDRRHAQSLQARQDVVCERGILGVTNGPAEYTRMDCASLTAHANPATSELIQLVADGGVQLRQPTSQAQGDRAVYTHADQTLRLLGHPRIELAQGVYVSDEELVWDNAQKFVRGSKGRFIANPALLKDAEKSEKLF